MAEESDDSQKTEEPTGQRLDEARKRGQLIHSKEIDHLIGLAVAAAVVLILGPKVMAELRDVGRGLLEHLHQIPLDGGGTGRLLLDLILRVALIIALPILLLLVGAIAPSMLQNGLVVATQALTPKFDRLNPWSGLKNLFTTRSAMQLLKDLLKLVIVGSVAAWMILPELKRVELQPSIELPELMRELHHLVFGLMVGILSIFAAIAGLDYFYQKYAFLKQMRMTKQEVKDEFKQSEGDPMVKGRLRQIRMERARKRMMAAVPQSDVVVTNPTHYAVALKYDQNAMAAPKLVAKGADLVAFRIRELAKANNVPLVENAPLARTLYAAVDLDQEIPPEHYQAVAQVISYVYKLKGKTAQPS